MAAPAAPEWRAHAGIGIILLLDTLILKLAPTGPWDSESFSLGVIGLTGLTLLYVAWYRLTFQRKGLVPWMDLWVVADESLKKDGFQGILRIPDDRERTEGIGGPMIHFIGSG